MKKKIGKYVYLLMQCTEQTIFIIQLFVIIEL